MSDQQQRDAAADLEVCEAATPGRWSNECGEVFDVPPDDKSTISIEVHQRREDKQQRDANLAFVALAREALPWWIAEAERLRAEPTPLARLEAWAAVTPGRRYRIEPGRVCLTAVVVGHRLDIRDAYATAGRPMPGLSPSGKRVYLPDSATTGELILAALAKWEELYGD